MSFLTFLTASAWKSSSLCSEGGQEADAAEVDAEAVDGLHADGVVGRGVVLVLDPVGELTVEGVERGEVELFDEELVADAAVMWSTT